MRPNTISIASVVCAAIAAAAFYAAAAASPALRSALLLVAAAAIQLRLLCNLLDGMLAVEEGLKTRTGDIYNDVPDRLADVLILAGAGYSVRYVPGGVALGWAAAVAAVFTAYVRLLAGSLGATQHFIGPMAKQHRMFTVTLAALLSAAEAMLGLRARSMALALGLDRCRIDRDGMAAHGAARRGSGRAVIGSALAGLSRLVTGATVVWHCDPRREGPRIYFGNHSSHLDFMLIWSALPTGLRRGARPVAGRDYWENGPVRRYLAAQVFHAVLIDRAGEGVRCDPTAARASIERMAAELDAGHSLIVFPEGTRARDGDVGPFKSGLFHLARTRPDAELVPVYLENLNRILPKGRSCRCRC